MQTCRPHCTLVRALVQTGSLLNQLSYTFDLIFSAVAHPYGTRKAHSNMCIKLFWIIKPLNKTNSFYLANLLYCNQRTRWDKKIQAPKIVDKKRVTAWLLETDTDASEQLPTSIYPWLDTTQLTYSYTTNDHLSTRQSLYIYVWICAQPILEQIILLTHYIISGQQIFHFSILLYISNFVYYNYCYFTKWLV